MVRCWTCGAIVSDLCYTCSLCESLTELKRFQNMVRTYGRGLSISDKFENMVKVQENCFRNLRETVAKEQLSELASAIEWSFETVNWELQLQTDALLNIDNTLKTSFEKHANEWRKNAEISSRSEEIDASEKVFLNALEVNPSDYRIYVGLGFIYLRRNKFYAAKTILENSLAHAPKNDFDYKSYSYRLIGHLYACEEDFNHAEAVLYNSIELSPAYEDGHYDYAQYSAQMKNIDNFLTKKWKGLESFAKFIGKISLCISVQNQKFIKLSFWYYYCYNSIISARFEVPSELKSM